MRLNRLERAAMNNPLRSALQRHVEARKLIRMGGRVEGGCALELGCGRGVGAELILREFGAATVDAFDLDVSMVVKARKRLSKYRNAVRVWVGDSCALSLDDSAYDAVFDFGIIHHVPAWPRVIHEVFRVLKPGGRFYCEEVLGALIDHPIARRLFDHPGSGRFDAPEFLCELKSAGFEIVASEDYRGLIAFCVARKPRFQVNPALGCRRSRRDA